VGLFLFPGHHTGSENEAGSSKNIEAGSCTEMVYERSECRKHNTQYLYFLFTNIDVNGEEKPQYLLSTRVLAADSMRANKCRRYLETTHAECVGKHLLFP
jgi:hypothetical protein